MSQTDLKLKNRVESTMCSALQRGKDTIWVFSYHLHPLHRASEEEARLGVAAGNRTRDLLHCRRILYAKSHSNGVIDCYSEPRLVLLQYKVICGMKKDVQSREKNGGSRPEKCFLSAQKCFSNIGQIYLVFLQQSPTSKRAYFLCECKYRINMIAYRSKLFLSI